MRSKGKKIRNYMGEILFLNMHFCSETHPFLLFKLCFSLKQCHPATTSSAGCLQSALQRKKFANKSKNLNALSNSNTALQIMRI